MREVASEMSVDVDAKLEVEVGTWRRRRRWWKWREVEVEEVEGGGGGREFFLLHSDGPFLSRTTFETHIQFWFTSNHMRRLMNED